jgi:hypothetical protein
VKCWKAVSGESGGREVPVLSSIIEWISFATRVPKDSRAFRHLVCEANKPMGRTIAPASICDALQRHLSYFVGAELLVRCLRRILLLVHVHRHFALRAFVYHRANLVLHRFALNRKQCQVPFLPMGTIGRLRVCASIKNPSKFHRKSYGQTPEAEQNESRQLNSRGSQPDPGLGVGAQVHQLTARLAMKWPGRASTDKG